MAAQNGDGSSKKTREQQLVDQATELFSGGGYRATGLQEIADALGITRPLFYYYFSSKEDLLWRIIGHLGDDLLVASEPIAQSDDAPSQKLEELITLLIEAFLSNIDPFRIYYAERHLLQGDRLRSIRRSERAFQTRVVDIIKDGQDSGEFRAGNPRLLARFIVGMARSVTGWYASDGTLSSREMSVVGAELARSAVASSATPGADPV